MTSGFHIENFGCRAARADGEALSALLRSGGLQGREAPEAEVVIVNTCSVTAEADREARAYIRRTHRLNPDARILVTGCYAQRAPQEIAALEGVSAVVGNSHKALAPQIAMRLAAGEADTAATIVPISALTSSGAAIWADDAFAHSFLEEAQVLPGAQTRPNLKIQEGCSNRCTFCVIPQTRGNSRSLSSESILRQVRNFVEAGGNELVFSGINLGRWGRDWPRDLDTKPTLAILIRTILTETKLPRLRLSSIEPMDWDADLIALFRDFPPSRLARHAHLPLQSGSDAVLRRMHRRYRPWHYVEKAAALSAACGDTLTLGADVMAGFPGETDAEFTETYELIRALPFGYLHLFPFSPRPGTRAWELHRQWPVPPRVVTERMTALRTLAREKTRTHRQSMIGRTLDAITLNTPDSLAGDGCTAALTQNFLPVQTRNADGSITAPNSLVSVRITALADDLTLAATLVSQHPVVDRVFPRPHAHS
ncbi:MiaB/RimO family radical SAM methylthiotransferase [Terracidiphilus gabretensis]|uniref:MiaB/RimO family radical SAM methylthiotransferase n=1 Tax=Terracidiphilus gabretensis TaxID=1577687 RepID=UPI00071B3804|nr:MiaB/RimO family radical SAM methylthiotransferase [Terracidiphilus gabretensis]